MLSDSDRAHARAAATVRDAERLMQVQVGNVAAELARLSQPDHRVHVRAIDINLAAGLVDRVAHLNHLRVKHAVGGRVGDHDRGDLTLIRFDLRGKIALVDRTVISGLDNHHAQARQDSRGRVRAVRGGRDEAHIAVSFATGLMVLADREQARVFALGTGVRLDRNPGVTGDRFKPLFKISDQLTPTAGLGYRSERVDACVFRPRDGLHLRRRVQFHGARTQRDHRPIQREIAVRQPG